MIYEQRSKIEVQSAVDVSMRNTKMSGGPRVMVAIALVSLNIFVSIINDVRSAIFTHDIRAGDVAGN